MRDRTWKIIGFFASILFVLCLSIALSARSSHPNSSLMLPSIFSDNMVLQQQRDVAIWGWAQPGTNITVQFRDRQVTTQTELDGKWITRIPSGEAGGPFQMEILGPSQRTIKNVLVGEVWVAGGQSNMWWPVSRCYDAESEITRANHPNIRIWDANSSPQNDGWPASKPQKTVPANWEMTSPKTVGAFPGTAYFFARELQPTLGVPIGIVHLAVPGQAIETFLSEEFLDRHAPETFAWWNSSTEHQQKAKPGKLFNGMVYPTAPYTARGFIWWQGESNTSRSHQYRVLFPSLIQEWRSRWRDDPAPFLFVQLANFLAPQTHPSEDDPWPALRDAQTEALKLPHTAMVAAIDVLRAEDDFNDIHPPHKQLIGHRLYLAAMAKVYGKTEWNWSSPAYQSVKFEGDRAIVSFNHAETGLGTKTGEQLQGFALAGEDRRFFWAEGTIEGDRVILTSQRVPQPVAVRYAWANNPVGNLYNKAGLPAFPFRTDNWILGTNKSHFRSLTLLELASEIQRELFPSQKPLQSLWEPAYQAIGEGKPDRAKQLIAQLLNQTIEDENLEQALQVLQTQLGR